MGRWLAGNTPPTATVAAGDIGLLGYASGRRILDLEGLVTTASLPLRARASRDEIVRERRYLEVERPQYVVDGPTERPARLGPTATGPRATPVYSCRMESLGVSQPGDHFYTLYRLDYEAAAP
jgi:hypothetical protein